MYVCVWARLNECAGRQEHHWLALITDSEIPPAIQFCRTWERWNQCCKATRNSPSYLQHVHSPHTRQDLDYNDKTNTKKTLLGDLCSVGTTAFQCMVLFWLGIVLTGLEMTTQAYFHVFSSILRRQNENGGLGSNEPIAENVSLVYALIRACYFISFLLSLLFLFFSINDHKTRNIKLHCHNKVHWCQWCLVTVLIIL